MELPLNAIALGGKGVWVGFGVKAVLPDLFCQGVDRGQDGESAPRVTNLFFQSAGVRVLIWVEFSSTVVAFAFDATLVRLLVLDVDDLALELIDLIVGVVRSRLDFATNLWWINKCRQSVSCATTTHSLERTGGFARGDLLCQLEDGIKLWR